MGPFDRHPPPLRLYGVDFDEQVATVALGDEPETSLPIPAGLFPSPVILRRASIDIPRREIEITLPAGDVVFLEAEAPSGAAPAPSRPVVYLDQLHWIALAKHRWAPERLSDTENEAAESLIEKAEQRELTIVMSAANITEATQTDGRHRRHLATMLLALSRGWQMRNPLAIRAEELRTAMKGDDPRVPAPFSLSPGAIFTDGSAPPEPPEDFPPDWAHWFQVMTGVSATVSTMIEDEKISKSEGNAMATRWAHSHHELALHVRDHIAKTQKRSAGHARFLADMAREIVMVAEGVGFDQPHLDTWLREEMASDLARMPYLGRQYEVIIDRLKNADDRWEGNDLTDINFLACAAGYADLVVGEKKVSEHLQRANGSVTKGAFVCRRLADAVEFLERRAEG